MQKTVKFSNLDKELLAQVKLWLESDLQAPSSLISLCKRSGLNREKLKKGFKMLYGLPPHTFHLQLRMKDAKRMVLETEKPVSEIAFLLGYEHTSNFCAAFKKFEGCAPLGLRLKK